MRMQSYKVLFSGAGIPVQANVIQAKLASFSNSYCRVTRRIIDGSLNLDEGSYRENVATLMPAFKMTRRGVFHGISPKSHVLGVFWKEFGKEFKDLRGNINRHSSVRSRALLEVPEYILGVTSDLFDT
jgi:hypothetical protein